MIECPVQTLIYRDDGYIFKEPLRDFIKGGFLFPASANVPITPAARTGSANGQSAGLMLEAPTDSWLEVLSLIGLDDSTVNADVAARECVTITAYNDGQISYMARPVNCTHVFGTPSNPLFLTPPFCEPILLQPQGILRFEFTNPSTAGAMSYRFCAEIRKFQSDAVKNKRINDGLNWLWDRRRKVYPYWVPLRSNAGNNTDFGVTDYGVPGINIPSNANAPASFIVTINKEVVVTRIMASVVKPAGSAGDTREIFSCDIYDGFTDTLLNNQPITFNNLGGPATFAYVLPTPMILRPNSVVRCRFYNLVTNKSVDAFVTLQGFACDLETVGVDGE